MFSPKSAGALSDTFHLKIDLSDGDSTTQVLRDYTVFWNQNNAPVAVDDSGLRHPNHTFKTRVATLLANDADPERDPISIVSVQDPSPAGSKVSIQGDWVIFTPPAVNETIPPDRAMGGFTYTVTDNHGQTATGNVRLTTPASLRSHNLSRITPLADHSGVQLEFVGIPNRTYEVFYSSGLAVWKPLGRFSSGPTGSFSVTDLFSNGGLLRFYRTQVIE